MLGVAWRPGFALVFLRSYLSQKDTAAIPNAAPFHRDSVFNQISQLLSGHGLNFCLATKVTKAVGT
jgi:hypothetical protein